MDDPNMTNYTFTQNMRNPWVMSSGDELHIPGSTANDLTQEGWNEWMGWDASQAQSPKQMGIHGPLGALKQEGQRSPLLNRRQPGHSLDIPSTDGSINNSYVFGGVSESQPAFAFKGIPTTAAPHSTSAQDVAFTAASWDPIAQFDALNGLSAAGLERQRLQQQALAGMLPHSTPSLQHSPSSLTHAATSPSSTESSPGPAAAHNKKRKSSEDDSSELINSDKQPPIKKTAHNMIEKRYRTNLNDKIAALRDSVPSLRIISRSTPNDQDDDNEDLEGLTPAHKLNKATVLSKATEYIHHLEKRNKRLADEVIDLKNRIDHYNKITMAGGPMRMPNNMPTPDPMGYSHDPFNSIPVQGPQVSQAPPQGMIPVPESIANLRMAAQSQQHYAYSQTGGPPHGNYPMQAGGPPNHQVPNHAQHPQQHMNVGRRMPGGGMMGKLMVGSLAGLMIVEGWSEREQSGEEPNGRGLFALPLNLMKSRNLHTFHGSLHGASIQQTMFGLARFMLVVFAMIYLLAPYIPFPRHGSRKKNGLDSRIRLSPAPSLASPVEVRRKAWLTAIQTVWVPRHNFLLEAAALGLKTLKLSTRKLIGWDGYAYLTGITRDQETARIKAWEIALDAQLTGGDAEISNSRLLLTLMASGTLPDTPARLMLKALHVRVLLWGYANAGYASRFIIEELGVKIARHYWNKAREDHRIASNSKDSTKEDRLPPHLAALVKLDCDQVLVDSIVHRAYDVAWNKSGEDATTANDETLDTVVEDFAISSPLDALAAWWSSTVLSQVLVAHLATSETQELTPGIRSRLDQAVSTAPPLSGSLARALVARALLVPAERKESILGAMKILPHSAINGKLSPASYSTMHLSVVTSENSMPAAADMKKSIMLAKCLQLVKDAKTTQSSAARQRATSFINYVAILPNYDLTLLSFVASHEILLEFSRDKALLNETRHGLERLSSRLRIWIGCDTARRSGISNKTRSNIVDRCVTVSKLLVGLTDTVDDFSEEVDAGYVSGSDGMKSPPSSPVRAISS